MNIAVYPGSFDPTTYGHMDIIERAAGLSARLIVAVLGNASKKAFFTVDERMSHLRALTAEMHNVEVMSFSGLLVDFASQVGANTIIRGLRAMTDFEYEFQMALTNKSLNQNIETLFLPADARHLYLSSSVVKEIASHGKSYEQTAPQIIIDELNRKMKQSSIV